MTTTNSSVSCTTEFRREYVGTVMRDITTIVSAEVKKTVERMTQQ